MADEMSVEIQQKIGELQLLQQRLSVFTSQKQQLQMQQAEVENALAEIKSAKPPIFKIIGEVLIAKDAEELRKELKEKEEEMNIRIKSIEKQEEQTRNRAKDLQKEITDKLK